jgi:hypothetical protein
MRPLLAALPGAAAALAAVAALLMPHAVRLIGERVAPALAAG